MSHNRTRTKNLADAVKLYESFTGHKAKTVTIHDVPAFPQEGLAIGLVSGIIYTTSRDGRTEHYIHRFSKKSRPLLAASHDGKQLILLGGAYDFTAEGIVDRKSG